MKTITSILQKFVVRFLISLFLCVSTLAQSPSQAALESRFDSFLNPENQRTWMRRLAARPHHLGSRYGKENAEFMAGLFRSWGYDTEIVSYDVLFPSPKTRIVEMIAPTRYRMKLVEPAIASDPSSRSATGAATDIQRLLHRRRCERRGGVRKLRPARGL